LRPRRKSWQTLEAREKEDIKVKLPKFRYTTNGPEYVRIVTEVFHERTKRLHDLKIIQRARG
jgi:hypothetical protein